MKDIGGEMRKREKREGRRRISTPQSPFPFFGESLRTESPRLSAEVENITKLIRENVIQKAICEVFSAKNNGYRPEK